MSYKVKEIFYTFQGEGANCGRVAVFCRFSGCNLWSGLEKDRYQAICQFCDTDFRGMDGVEGSKFNTGYELAEKAKMIWQPNQIVNSKPLIVCTGGEPLLQLDIELLNELHKAGFEVAVETNGTKPAPVGIDWICVSPKAGADVVLTSGDELKLVFPQTNAPPHLYKDLNFKNFFLQPMDGTDREKNTRLAIEYCLAHPQWRLSLQTHKLLGIP